MMPSPHKPVLLPASMGRYQDLLRKHFGYSELRPGQQHVLRALAEGDVLAVMPTGGGKSQCYILPALAVGKVLVVSPLIALMHDQVESLRAAGVPAAAINSSIGREEQNRLYLEFVKGGLQLLYVAPERLRNDRFVDGLRRAGIHLLAIDEAHCVSEWGHDFRPDYLMLGYVRRQLGEPRTLALTATAEPRVREDIAGRLGIGENGSIIVTSVDRPNLAFRVVPIDNESSRKEWLVNYLKQRPGQTGIVYARTRGAVENLTETLREAGIDAEAYHAGMPSEARTAIQRRFATDRRRVIVATNAFGLGIDKPDVRFVVHANMPGRLESYYQEAGRAGRDGDPAECVLLFQSRDASAQRRFIEQAHPDDKQVQDMWQRIQKAKGEAVAQQRDSTAEDGLAMALAALRAANFVDVYGNPTRKSPHSPAVGEYIGRHKRYAEERLQRMVAYAQSEQCRRAFVLEYFGESAEDCGMCDNCQAENHPESDSLSKKLSALCHRLAERYGRAPYEILESRTIQELAAYRPRTHEELLDTWGIGEVKAGWFGKDILSAIREWESAHPNAPPRDVRRQRRKRLTAAPTIPVEDRLYQLLVEWRRDRADRDGVPAYVICNNQTLREITLQRPQDEHALTAVWGLGQARIERYGEEILALVNPSRLLPPRK